MAQRPSSAPVSRAQLVGPWKSANTVGSGGRHHSWDQSLVFNTSKGLVLLSGCGHAGVVNTLTFAEKEFPSTPVYALIGGFHLFNATDQQLDWTADKFKGWGVSYLVGAHCTGIEAVYRIRQRLNLSRQSGSSWRGRRNFRFGRGHPTGEDRAISPRKSVFGPDDRSPLVVLSVVNAFTLIVGF